MNLSKASIPNHILLPSLTVVFAFSIYFIDFPSLFEPFDFSLKGYQKGLQAPVFSTRVKNESPRRPAWWSLFFLHFRAFLHLKHNAGGLTFAASLGATRRNRTKDFCPGSACTTSLPPLTKTLSKADQEDFRCVRAKPSHFITRATQQHGFFSGRGDSVLPDGKLDAVVSSFLHQDTVCFQMWLEHCIKNKETKERKRKAYGCKIYLHELDVYLCAGLTTIICWLEKRHILLRETLQFDIFGQDYYLPLLTYSIKAELFHLN